MEQVADAGNSAEKIIADAEALLKGTEGEGDNTNLPPDKQETQDGNVEPVKKEEEDLDHGEKSRIGRKVKRLESTISEMREVLEEVRNLARSGATSRQEKADDDPEPELDEIPTAEQVREHSAWTRRQIKKETVVVPHNTDEQMKKDYEKAYLKLLSEIDPEDEPELYALLTDEKSYFNRTHSGYKDPAKDFARNLTGATKALRSKPLEKKPNVQGKGSSAATGFDTGGTPPPPKGPDREKILKGLSSDERAIAESLSDDEFKAVFGK